MNTATRLRQVRTIAGLQLRHVFFARRSLWVYVLAFFPAIIFFGHGAETMMDRYQWAHRIVPASTLESVPDGSTPDEVSNIAGEPINDRTFRSRPREKDGPRIERRQMRYFDGRRFWTFDFADGILERKSSYALINFNEDRTIFAAVFQYYYLRLAVFFGCLGIFMNLFRGEMLDKTLHFWFLAPARRDVLLAGKYLAGLVAATFIFTAGAAVCFLVMLWPQEPSELAAFWPDPGLSHLLWYCAAAALGCIGYGSVFLAAGLLLRNPIIPAVVLLFWEGANPFLPDILQKFSVLYYVQALTPVPAPIDSGAPLLIRMLMSPAEPPSTVGAVVGLIALTALVLWAASWAVSRLEINYGTD